MSEADAFEVDTVALVSHAGAIDAIADELAFASQAGEIVRTGTEAYGQLCRFVPVLLNDLQLAMTDGINTADSSLRDTSDVLRSVAASYDVIDGDAADRIRNTR